MRMNDYPDGNTAALRLFEKLDDAWDTAYEVAKVRRNELVREYAANSENDDVLKEILGDLAAEDGEFLHSFQRGDSTRMWRLFLDRVDFIKGEDLVRNEAELIMAEA
jgi:hypothetical protein